MKCKICGKKVFRTISDKKGSETAWRMCVNCKTVHNFIEIFKEEKDVRGAFEYDVEN